MRITGFIPSIVAAMALATVAACGSDSSAPTIPRVSTTSGNAGGTDTSGTRPEPTPTSTAPAASLTLTPHALSLPAGYYARLVVVARDAAGILITRQPSWRSSNSAIVFASDTGLVGGKATGTAYVYATLDSHTDSALVTVTAAQNPVPVQGAPAVASFNLTYSVFGAVSNADTSATAAVPGAVVSVTRLVTAAGDTLHTSDPAVTSIADANGVAHFTNLPGGAYHIDIVPPSDSPYSRGTAGIGPPTNAEATAKITLLRKP